MKKKKSGFTLIEIMIAVVTVGIITAVALPSYQASIRKSNRAEAKTELMDIAQRLQRCYTLYARFDDTTNCGVYKDLIDANKYMTRGGAYYEISITPTTANDLRKTTYTLTATAKKLPQTKDTVGGCNELKLEHTGVKSPAACW